MDPGGGGKKKNNTHGEQPARKKDNTNGRFGLGFGSGFSLLVDDTGTIHVQDSDMNDVNAITNGVMGQIPKSNVLSPSSLTKADLRKLDVNVPNEANYDVWLPLASVHEVSDIMKNSLYGYIIGKRLAFPVVEWFVHNNWEKYSLKKVTLGKGFFSIQF
ncbi:hypothetical protein Tco_1539823 [Tanacetum coccineum]